MFINIKHCRRHQRTLVVFAAPFWLQRTLCAGAHAIECAWRESHPARSAFLATIHASQPPRVASLACTAAAVRDSETLRSCRVTRAAQPRAVQRAAGTALLPRRSGAKNQNWSAWHGLNRHEQVKTRISTTLRRGSVSHGYRPVARSAVAWAISNGESRPTRHSSRRAAVRWPGASAPVFARRCASRSRVRKAARG